MRYRVEIADRAERDLEQLYLEKQAIDSPAAARWFNDLEVAITSLERFPLRCPIAPEARKMGRSLRNLLYGKKPHVYRVIYLVDRAAETVSILTIRHGAMQPATDLTL